VNPVENMCPLARAILTAPGLSWMSGSTVEQFERHLERDECVLQAAAVLLIAFQRFVDHAV